MIHVTAKVLNKVDAKAIIGDRVVERIAPINVVDYLSQVVNKPSINGVVLKGNISSDDLHIVKHNTTEYWNNATGYIPQAGEIIIYDDYASKQVIRDGVETTVFIPNIKIGSGNAYVQDLMFVSDDVREELYEHIMNQYVHISEEERLFWNDKVSIDESDLLTGKLIFKKD